MSKFLLLLALAGLVSCAGEQPIGETVGESKTFEPLINYEDNERVKVICEALVAKEGTLNVLVASAKEFTYGYAQKVCDEEKMPEMKDVPVKVMKSGKGYYFSPKNGENFGFSNVETSTDGVLNLICNYGSTLESPIRLSPTSKTATWWSTFTDATKCQAGFGTICINIQTGSSSDGFNYTIHTNEWIKFKVSGENQGFFVERKLVSNAGCKKNKTLEMKAVLK
jgi:hypothetical protein